MTREGFWRNRRVLVTGHTGFKGSWLSAWLCSLGARVKGYALAPATQPNLFSVLGLERDIEHAIGDIRDGERLRAEVTAFEPDIVFHLAAQAFVRLSYEQPHLTFDTNVMGCVSLLESVRSCESVSTVVVVTTDKCYEDGGSPRAYRESDPVGGFDPYSSSKACAELVTSAYRRSFFSGLDQGSGRRVAIATARAGNVIGGGDWSRDRLVPDVVQSILEQRPVRIRNPHAVRPWQHVLDALGGYLALAEKLHDDGAGFGEAWNFGPGDEAAVPVLQIVEQVLSLWPGNRGFVLDSAPRPHESASLRLDSSKARERLGWRPRWDLATTVSQTVRWYRAWHGGTGVRGLTFEQIADFSAGPGGAREAPGAGVR